MPFLNPAHEVLLSGQWLGANDKATLDCDGRFVRRKRITTDSGASVMVDLAETTSLAPGDALRLESGRLVEIAAADEPVVVIRGANLPRLA